MSIRNISGKMFYMVCVLFLKLAFCDEDFRGWSYINLHCRSNDNTPLDWWYIYKPARQEQAGHFLETGRKFAFISSESEGKWQRSDKHIIENSMLQYTLSPLYRPTYVEHFASLIYSDREGSKNLNGSASNGVLMADLNGSVWVGHSIPGMPNLEEDRATFPVDEFEHGHLMFCISMDVEKANLLGALLHKVILQINHLSIPPIMRRRLVLWKKFSYQPTKIDMKPPNYLIFTTPNTQLKAAVIIRRPGEKMNPYEVLARKQGVILDVYGQRQKIKTHCNKNYGVRKINKISLKFNGDVDYINASAVKDNMGFAVSTASSWQSLGSGKKQYWACTTSVDNFYNTAIGGLILCVLDSKVWFYFDNLKVNEPKC